MPAAARTSGPQPPAPAPTLPIASGVFVPLGHMCEAPDERTLVTFDGRDLARPQAQACRTTVIASRASLYIIENSCLARSDQKGRRYTERFEVAVAQASHFSIRSGNVRSRYKLCPMHELSARFRQRSLAVR